MGKRKTRDFSHTNLVQVTYWLLWLFVTRVRQFGFDSLKALYLVITTIAHPQTFDRCVELAFYLHRKVRDNGKIFFA